MTSTTADPSVSVPSQASIVTHPWFPKVIGLWFAALFGLCSLALDPGMLETAVTGLGIDRIVPAAAPPLGQTARLLLAMGMAGLGEIAGLLIGARIAAIGRPQVAGQRQEMPEVGSESQTQVRTKDRHADAPPLKPLSAVDDLGGEADHHPRPLFEVAGLLGEQMPVPESETEATATTPPILQPGAAQAPDLAHRDAPVDEPAVAETAPIAAPFGAPAEPVAAPDPEVLPDLRPFPMPTAPTASVASASLESLGVVQLSERLALALQARRQRLAHQTAAVAVAAPGAVHSVPEEIGSEGVASEPRAIPHELPGARDILARRLPRPVRGQAEDHDDIADETAQAEGYSSLLAMGSGAPRGEAVRIEEPESDTIEPVMIFLGQGARVAGQAPGPFSTPFGEPTAVCASASKLPASSVPAGSMQQADPEETERAVRAALASLQRNSGAR